MPLSIDSQSNGSLSGWSHTVGTSLGDAGLICVIMARGQGAVVTITGATYGGVAMTEVGRKDIGGSGNYMIVVYKLYRPPTGSNSFAFTTTGTQISKGYAISFYGTTNAIIRPSSFMSAGPVFFNISVSVPSAIGDYILDAVAAGGAVSDGSPAETPTAGQTAILTSSHVQSSTKLYYAAGYKAGAIANTTMSYADGARDAPIMVGLAIQPRSMDGQAVISPAMIF